MRLFLKEDFVNWKKGNEAYVLKKVGDVYGIKFITSKGCSWCSGQLYHGTFTEDELKEKFTIIEV